LTVRKQRTQQACSDTPCAAFFLKESLAMNQKTLLRGVLAAGLITALGAGLSLHSIHRGALDRVVASAAAASPAGAGAQLPGFSGIVENYGPVVVNISVTGEIRADAPPQLDPNDPFYEFFKRFGPAIPRQPMRGQGSGFIVGSDGIILTNAHVVDGAQEVDVKLTDRREFRAKVLGVDPHTDVAVIKIDAHDLPTVKLGDPAATKVGDWVLAIGSPFGFENTVTAGIVSAKGRSLPDETYVPFIQTDVAVNPGNSGGPLFNLQGEVIGINSQIYSGTGGYQGLSFAIPIDVATKVQRQLAEHGTVTRGRIGVSVQDVNQSLANSFGLARPEGALVNSVEKGGPADKAGLQPGDVILKLNEHAIATSADLPALVADLKPGSTARLEVLRNGARRELQITVGRLKEPRVASSANAAEKGRLGLAVRPLEPEEQQQAGVEGGLLVEGVAGPAARAGIQPGDVILQVNGTPIRSVEQLRALSAKSGKHLAVLVQREDARLFLALDLG
jgi:serine protease Do